MSTLADKTKARSKAGAAKPEASKTEATKKRKPRADKGKKRAPGSVPGRPVGTGKPVNAGLLGRMANVDAWLTLETAVVKATGIATKAKLNARILQTMRDGERILTEAEVHALETAAGPYGYRPSKTY